MYFNHSTSKSITQLHSFILNNFNSFDNRFERFICIIISVLFCSNRFIIDLAIQKKQKKNLLQNQIWNEREKKLKISISFALHLFVFSSLCTWKLFILSLSFGYTKKLHFDATHEIYFALALSNASCHISTDKKNLSYVKLCTCFCLCVICVT